ncbi:ABC-2 family transporter protein [Brevibacillus thermoruber]|uniref:ABC-2 family transporter protein n=1 Tax=Brevibacillus thermoruber TaxID=33942 RepID=UPI001E638F58|nr:ABC-2 family transporter protein [Brevibacillus thermoruber]
MSGWRDRVNQRDSRQNYQGKLSYGASLFHGFISAGLRQKPFRSQLGTPLLLTRNLELGRIGGIVQGLVVFGVAVAGLHAQGKPVWDVVLYAPVALLAGSAIFFALSLATATLCFWTHQTKDLQTFTLHAPANASNYPVSLYPGWLKGLFFSVIPVAFVNYVPMRYLCRQGRRLV